MTSRTHYAHGEPCWADLQTRDVAAAKDFYGAVFGWTFQDLPTPDGRRYSQAFLGRDVVAVIAPQNPMQEAAGTPGQWNIYFAATDAEEICEDAVHAGGKLEFGPEQVADTGVLAFVAPPPEAAPRASGSRARTAGATASTNTALSHGRNS